MKTISKIALTGILCASALLAHFTVTNLVAPPLASDLAIVAVNGTADDFYAAQSRWPAQNTLLACFWTLAILGSLAIWRKELRNLRTLIAAVGATMFILPFGPVGCAQYDVPEYVEVTPSQTAFVVPLESSPDKQVRFESEEYLEKLKVSAKRIQVPHR